MKMFLVSVKAVLVLGVLAITDGADIKQQGTYSLLMANQVQNAAFNDVSPGFDDLYMITTQDKGRDIVIYCNAAYCYKNRNAMMTA